MYFKQFYLGCLAHASYMIGSRGEAAVVDPRRDVEEYIEEAAANGFEIKYVIETHFHADFVSGHRELASRTGAEIVFGRRARVGFPHRPVGDGEELRVGAAVLRFLETPGHTPESISIVVTDSESETPGKVLTGDTLFIGDVGRPDLVGAQGLSAEEMAGMLYDSLHDKLLCLPDDVEVYPAHGAGSMCGRNISKERSSTIGHERRFNYALKAKSREDFIGMMTAELPEAPIYFSRDAEINRAGARPLSELPDPKPVGDADLPAAGAVLDVRSPAAFGSGHIPGSISIGLGGQFASWAGSLLDSSRAIVLVAEDREQIDEAVMRLARVGIESVKGYVEGGIYGWAERGGASAELEMIPVDELRSRMAESPDLQIVDVRRPSEYSDGHVPGAVNLPLSHLRETMDRLDRDRPVAVICQSGYRSTIAASIMERGGFRNLSNVVGGTAGWVNAHFEVELAGAVGN